MERANAALTRARYLLLRDAIARPCIGRWKTERFKTGEFWFLNSCHWILTYSAASHRVEDECNISFYRKKQKQKQQQQQQTYQLYYLK